MNVNSPSAAIRVTDIQTMIMMLMMMKRIARLLFVITNGFKLTDTMLKQACHTSFRSGLTARGVSEYSSSKLKQLLITTHRCSNPLQQITSTKTSASGSSIHWPASVQHAVSFTRMLHSEWDTCETFATCVNKISFLCLYYVPMKHICFSNHYNDVTGWQSLGSLLQHAITRQFEVACSQHKYPQK